MLHKPLDVAQAVLALKMQLQTLVLGSWSNAMAVVRRHLAASRGARPRTKCGCRRQQVVSSVSGVVVRSQAASVSLQGAAPTPWGRWTRQWTAEENRHGDAMNKYMYLSGKVNLKVRQLQQLLLQDLEP